MVLVSEYNTYLQNIQNSSDLWTLLILNKICRDNDDNVTTNTLYKLDVPVGQSVIIG
jgi:hypothetical protein